MKKLSNRFFFYIAVGIFAVFLVSQLLSKSSCSPDKTKQAILAESGESVFAAPTLYQPLKNVRIVLDPGHGGNDPGAIWEDICEKDITLQISESLKQSLEKLGAVVFTTRDTDTYTALSDRIYIAQAKEADAFISIHLNSLDEDPTVHGIETYCTESVNQNNLPLAQAIHDSLIQETSAKDRKVRSDSDFYVVEKNTVPSCLIEVGFLTSETERPLLLSAAYQDKLVSGITNGLLEYFK